MAWDKRRYIFFIIIIIYRGINDTSWVPYGVIIPNLLIANSTVLIAAAELVPIENANMTSLAPNAPTLEPATGDNSILFKTEA